MDNSRLIQTAGYVILLAWLAALFAGIVTGEYEPLRDVTPVMLIFAGFAFGDRIVFKRKNGNGGGH